MKFKYLKPFRNSEGNVITQKCLVTINGRQHIECNEDEKCHYPETLIPMSTEDYEAYLIEKKNKTTCCCCSCSKS